MTTLRPLCVVLFVSCLACATPSTMSPDVARSTEIEGTASLTVEVLGLESNEGSVALALFDSLETFEQRTAAVASGIVAPQEGRAIWSVADLPAGIYAVAVFHDLNDNGELDRATLGPPAEPYGFSNDARGMFGPPRFENVAIEVPPGRHTIEIRLR